MKKLYKEYQLYYLKKYNFKMLETYKMFLSKFMPDKSAKFMLNKSDAPIMDIIS